MVTSLQVLVQEELIARVRTLARRDARLSAVLIYGSFARGGGDRFSDIDFWLFSEHELDRVAWIAQVGETYAIAGHVAIFKPSLVRGEFHFARSPAAMRDWRHLGVTRANLERFIVVDRDGRLREALERLVDVVPEASERVFLPWFLHGLDLLERGDLEKAQEILGIAAGALPPERAALVRAFQETWGRALDDVPADLRAAVTKRMHGL